MVVIGGVEWSFLVCTATLVLCLEGMLQLLLLSPLILDVCSSASRLNGKASPWLWRINRSKGRSLAQIQHSGELLVSGWARLFAECSAYSPVLQNELLICLGKKKYISSKEFLALLFQRQAVMKGARLAAQCMLAGSDEAAIEAPKRSACIQILQPLILIDFGYAFLFCQGEKPEELLACSLSYFLEHRCSNLSVVAGELMLLDLQALSQPVWGWHLWECCITVILCAVVLSAIAVVHLNGQWLMFLWQLFLFWGSLKRFLGSFGSVALIQLFREIFFFQCSPEFCL